MWPGSCLVVYLSAGVPSVFDPVRSVNSERTETTSSSAVSSVRDPESQRPTVGVHVLQCASRIPIWMSRVVSWKELPGQVAMSGLSNKKARSWHTSNDGQVTMSRAHRLYPNAFRRAPANHRSTTQATARTSTHKQQPKLNNCKQHMGSVWLLWAIHEPVLP